MNVSLTPMLSRFVEKQVASGRYQTASEVLRDGLRSLQERQDSTREELRRLLKIAADQEARGEWVEGPAAFEMARRIGQQRRKRRA